MYYKELVEVYDKVSQTTKRLEITDILVDFLKRCPPEIIDKVVYLTQGRLYPEFIPIELGVADRLIIRSISKATATKESEVEGLYKNIGDLGKVTQELLSKSSKQATLEIFSEVKRAGQITVEHVYESLDRIARATGEGSQEEKLRLLSDLLRDSSPREAMYIVRTVSGALRLGVADMTILDAMAVAFTGSKEARSSIERAYNMSSDLGMVAKTLVHKGLEAIKTFGPSPGRPIFSMLAERLSSSSEILEKMGGRCALEYKYDGERVQIHRNTGDAGTTLYSRRLENISHHYPDIVRLSSEGISSQSYIVEGEIVAIDPNTGDLLPFQELMHRRRKYGVEEAMAAYPASLRLFDILYADGKDYTTKTYPERRSALSKIVKESDRLRLAEQRAVDNPEALETFFEEAISNGCEGLVAKSLGEESVYKAGARGWLWIKYKREYRSEMMDTVDLVAVGGFMGTGKRAGHVGTLLLAAYEESEDVFRTVCRCSTGFTDEDIRNMRKLLEKDIIPHRHGRVDSRITPDIWVVPSKVLEVLGAEITLSPIHTCGLDAIRKGAGLAIRFPRFTGNWRSDKSPEDATTVNEIIEMYKKQLKKISE
ncbi:MAG: ATP-dependent DNA ligase [Candidatus Verstraetearchaeota archaeon]|nr:ATP-dependent DNA ligase [Candidatus Verstraetearchaeota archaeon]